MKSLNIQNTIEKIIEPALLRKKKTNPNFSLRQMALHLKLSPSFLTNVIKGKKKFPAEHLDSFIQFLDLDEIVASNLCEFIQKQELKSLLDQSKNFNKYFKKSNSKKITNKDHFEFQNQETIINPETKPYSELPITQMTLLNPWYNIAVLDLISLEHFSSEPKWISDKLGISIIESENALKFLLNNDYLSIDKNTKKFVKTDKKLRLPTKESHFSVRNYHTQMIKKGIEFMNTNSNKDEFKNRLITSVVIGTHSPNFESAKSFLHESLYTTADILSDGSADELYQLSVILFPLTKK